MTPAQRVISDKAYDIVDRAASMIDALGFEPGSSWRFLAWTSFDAIVAGRCPDCAKADLLRLRGMIDKHLARLADEAVPQ